MTLHVDSSSERAGIAATPGRNLTALLRGTKRFAVRKPLGAIGAAILLTFVVLALFAPLIAPYDPNLQIKSSILESPSSKHLLGTDQLGRDMLSRIIFGARISLFVSFIAVAFGAGVGTAVGLVSGYGPSALDTLLQRVVDGMMAFPGFILAMTIATVLGPGLFQVSFAIGVLQVPFVARVVRGSTLEVKTQAYMEAAQATGAGPVEMLWRHVLPNVLPTVIVIATLGLGGAILAEAGLSFLGLGQGPRTPSWGLMLSGQARSFMLVAPWLAIWPGLAITFTVLAFNLFGDALRDVLDPRLRGT